jgi:hypothetical protein
MNERSHLALRGFLAGVVDADARPLLVQLGVKSRMTDRLMAALLDHVRVCEAADTLIDRAKHPEVVALHEVLLPLGPGEEAEFGKADTATVVPIESKHPEEITASYLRGSGVWRSEAIHQAAVAAWDGIQEWAREFAERGDEDHGGGFGGK